MTLEELEQAIQKMRARPMLLICKTPKGKKQLMTPEECRRSGSAYIHISADDLDELLAQELGG